MFHNTEKPKFTIGINDDVTYLSLNCDENPDTAPQGIKSCKFWGLGSDGTVGANKNSIKIIGDHTDMNAQAYFDYDSKKSGGVTISHLRFGKPQIKSTYLINKADFVACHNAAYLGKYKMVEDLKPNGTFLLNCQWDAEGIEKHVPASVKRYIAQNNIQFYTIDGVKLGKEIGLGGRINTVLQSAFFKLADIIPSEDAIKYMKDAAYKSYSKKGDAIVEMNYQAIERGANEVVKVEVPEAWKTAEDECAVKKELSGNPEVIKYVETVMNKVNAQDGYSLPVSAFVDYVEGHAPLGSAAYEKRGVAIDVPEWNSANCIQCNLCSFVCPHAVIRPFVMNAEEAAAAPEGAKIPVTGMPGYQVAMGVSVLDCTGCGSCANVCPGKKGEKALTMKPLDTQLGAQKMFDYGVTLDEKPEVTAKFKPSTAKGSQYLQPMLEFSGACGGCGETPYAKLVTQLFGDRMYIANATGCSSIWGGSAPSVPYTTNKAGFGPAWANSLFEDNAEFGLGIYLGQKELRNRMIGKVKALGETTENAEVKAAIDGYLATVNDGEANKGATKALVAALEACGCDAAKEILKDKDFLAKKSVWIFGGDGWSYDIGFGGLDHALASGEDINVFVFDTEVYSNTGGQASKSTPAGAIAQFAAGGKAVKKKDLAAIAMSYGYVYVAQVAQGYNSNQLVKAVTEAESYNGPSLIIAYAPCINHGIKGGMKGAQTEEKKAVEAGYWQCFRYDPRLKDEGKNPLTLDSKAPSSAYRDFIMGEVRYNALARANKDRAEELFTKAENSAKEKYERLLAQSQK